MSERYNDTMGSKELTDYLFGTSMVTSMARAIAKELANRDLFPLTDFPQFVSAAPNKNFSVQCTNFYEVIRDIILTEDHLEKLLTVDKRLTWLNMSVWMSNHDEEYDVDTLAMYICINLIALSATTLDEHVENIQNKELHEELGIEADDEMLVSLSDPRLELKRRAIIVDGTMAIFPHQFMRRYYTSNFVDLPVMLAHIQKAGHDVSIRIDPLRKTEVENYTKEGLFEADYWHGPPFSKELLENPYKDEKTRHRSFGVINMSYDARYTVFRTKMMDKVKGLREFSIEEYCPLELPSGDISSAWGNKYYIQKFGHLVYDQKTGKFDHVDGAVRVFVADEYENHFNAIQRGSDIDEKAGVRHKLFLVKRRPGEPGFDLEAAQALLTEWFRYNPHIEEYFTGTKAKVHMTYEELDEIRAKRSE